ncbi:MAG: YceI family protein [Saprospiraceae bacterium]|nr:YceI family protein [Saprospiraceae bacterium]
MCTKTLLLFFAPALLFCSLGSFGIYQPTTPYRCDNGKVFFKSEATLEVIQARSKKLRGAIDPANNTFAWSVETTSFEGFNNPLQREHFNENFMESTKYPKISFVGKIIEKIDFQTDGIYTVRAKGKLLAHGVEQERIIRSELEVLGNKIRVRAQFTVPLADHNISIPHIVYQKIAEEIALSVEAELFTKTN